MEADAADDSESTLRKPAPVPVPMASSTVQAYLYMRDMVAENAALKDSSNPAQSAKALTHRKLYKNVLAPHVEAKWPDANISERGFYSRISGEYSWDGLQGRPRSTRLVIAKVKYTARSDQEMPSPDTVLLQPGTCVLEQTPLPSPGPSRQEAAAIDETLDQARPQKGEIGGTPVSPQAFISPFQKKKHFLGDRPGTDHPSDHLPQTNNTACPTSPVWPGMA